MLRIIQDIIYRVTGRTDITEETDFIKDLKLNSFDIVNIIAEFETNYNFVVPTKDLWKMHTVGDFIRYMTEKGIEL